MKMSTSAKILGKFSFIIPQLGSVKSEVSIGRRNLFVKETHGPIITRNFKSQNVLLSEDKYTRDPSKIVKKDGTVIRKKSPEVVFINLMKGSDVTVLSLKAAENVARANGLNLVKVEDKVKSARETFKLVADSELGTHESNETKKKGNLKTFIFSTTIVDNDLKTKIKLMTKVLKKHSQLCCLIKKVGTKEPMTLVYEKIIKELKEEGFSVSTISMKSSNKVLQFIIKVNLDSDKTSS